MNKHAKRTISSDKIIMIDRQTNKLMKKRQYKSRYKVFETQYTQERKIITIFSFMTHVIKI